MSSNRFILHVCCCIALTQFLVLKYAIAQPVQAERRNQLSSPGLTINSNLPTARVNVMKIHGDRIFMAGQDHVVRSYALKTDGDIDVESCRVYRWPSWREERGNILAMAISSDGTKMAIGGIGLKTALVCEIDLQTGNVIRVDDSLRSAITEIQYSANDVIWYGSFRGGVVRWPIGGKAKVIRSDGSGRTLVVRSIATTDVGCCVVSNGHLLKIENDKIQSEVAITESGREIVYAAFSFVPEMTVVFISRDQKADSSQLVAWNAMSSRSEVLWESDLNTQQKVVPELLRVGENGEIIAVAKSFDSASNTARIVFIKPLSKPQFTETILGSNENSTSMVSVSSAKIVMATSADKLLTFLKSDSGDTWQASSQVELASNVKHDVRWVESTSIAWTHAGKSFQFKLDQRSIEKHQIATSTKSDLSDSSLPKPIFDPSAASLMSLRFADGFKLPIILNLETDYAAIVGKCFTFEKKNYLVVGHRFGSSVFVVTTERNLQLVRKFIGHASNVTCIDVHTNGLILTGCNDGTICCFSLAPWKFHSELGASFIIQNGQLVVGEIDPGSPIWETGLNEGDSITKLYYAGQELDPSNALRKLEDPSIGEQLQFQTERLLRQGIEGVSTRCLQRPIWKFYERDGEWIWWRWRDYFYDCSTKGESLVSWQLNQGLDRSPIIIDGTEARARFYRPGKLKDLLTKSISAPERINAPDLVPPVVVMDIKELEDHYQVTATLKADSNSLLVGEPKELSVWVNDFRVTNWKQPQIGRPESCRLDKKILRSGKNRVIARAFNRIGIRGDSESQLIQTDTKDRRPVLRSLAIGIRDYSDSRKASTGGRGLIAENLRYTVRDAQVLKRLFEKQDNYFGVDAKLFIDGEATSENIFRQLEFIAQECRPDDWLILSFSGHGYSWDKPSDSNLPPSFMLLTSKTSLVSESAAARTAIPIGALDEGIQFENLFNAMAKIPCRKMLLIDACHSGGALDIVKALTPDLVVGPTILTASSKSQKAQEVPTVAHGVFTAAVIEALSDKFEVADQSQDARISPRELYQYTLRIVPEIFQDARRHLKPDDFDKGQTPEFWSPSEDQDIPIFARVQD